MTSSNISQCHISHQRPKKQKASEKEDRISKLPRNIMAHILSFLPTKDAVRTSVLSKRWIYIWTSITSLHFDDTTLITDTKKSVKKSFGDFLLRVLLHLKNPKIQSFTLEVTNKYDPALVNACISAILNRGVRKLRIHCPFDLIMFSSRPLFACESLEELVLTIYFSHVRVPAYVSLLNLKTLKLCGLNLNRDSVGYLEELVLSFPVLKEFECVNCMWLNVQNVSLQVPSLEIVVLEFEEYECEPTNCCTIKFYDSHLKEFSYNGAIIQDYVLSDPSSALNASAIIALEYDEKDNGREQDIMNPRACKLLNQFSQVKYLNLGQLEAFVRAKDSFADVPEFIMLCHLQLSFVKGEMLMELLLKSPNLTTLAIKGVSKFDDQLLDSAIMPDCIANLKTVKLGELNGYDDELCLAKFVMENAVVLQQLSFSPTLSLRHSQSDMERVKEKLLSFKKGLNLTIIDFSDL